MKVREVVTIAGWVDGSGWSYNQCTSDSIIEIGDSIPENMIWDWYEADYVQNESEDTQITVKYYAPDADLDDDIKPLATYSIWESELIEERNLE